MAKIFIFGSSSIKTIPYEIEQYILGLYSQGHEFIIGDNKGVDSAVNMILSRVGAIEKTTVYAMDRARNNPFGAKERIFNVYHDENRKVASIVDKDTNQIMKEIEDIENVEDIPGNKQYYEFKDRLMMDECAIAMCIWDGESKRELHCIQLMNIKEKPCYVYKLG